jgi:hypothetical protein
MSDMTSFTPLVTGITALRYMTFVDRSAADFSDKLAVSAFMVGSQLLRNVGTKLPFFFNDTATPAIYTLVTNERTTRPSRETSDPHNSADDDTSLLGCDTASTGT